MKAKELRQLTVEDLNKKLLDESKALFKLRMQKGTQQLAQTHLLKSTKKNIARIKTLLTEKAGS